MKPVIFLLILLFTLNGFVIAVESTNPAKLIIGMWQTEDKTIYNFSEDKTVFVNDVKYATYRFVASTLYLKYFASGDEFEAEAVFEEQKMILTEYKNGNEKTLVLKQVPR